MLCDVALELATFVVVMFVLPTIVAALWCLLVDPLDKWW